MKISSYVVLFLVGLSVFFFLRSLWTLFRPQILMGPSTILLSSILCLLCAYLISCSKGKQRQVMLLASLGIIAAYVQRILWLSLDSEGYQYWYFPVSTNSVNKALIFMILGTISFWIGSRYAQKTSAKQTTLITNKSSILFKLRNIILMLGYLFLTFRILLALKLDVGLYRGETTWGFLQRLLPETFISFIILYFLVKYWNRLSTVSRIVHLIFLFLLFLADTVVGQRGALLNRIAWFIIVVIWVRGDFRLPVQRTLVLTGLLAILVPISISISIFFRDTVRVGINPLDVLSHEGVTNIFKQDAFKIMDFISRRIAGFDALVAVVSYYPGDLEKYMTPLSGVKAFFSRLIPKWDVPVPGLGKLFSVFYQLCPWDMRTVGAWYGFGVVFGYFKYFGIIALGVYGFFVTRVFSWLSYRSEYMQAIGGYFLYVAVFAFFISGNIDNIFSQFIANITMMSLFYATMVVVARRKPLYAPVPVKI